MVGYNTILKIERLREETDGLGFKFCYPKHGSSHDSIETLGLLPKDAHSLPIYSRDAQLFEGTVDQLEMFLRGIVWARNYDRLIKLSTDEKRVQKEQSIRNVQLCKILKDEDHTKDLIHN
jgi:hypothetical protein